MKLKKLLVMTILIELAGALSLIYADANKKTLSMYAAIIAYYTVGLLVGYVNGRHVKKGGCKCQTNQESVAIVAPKK